MTTSRVQSWVKETDQQFSKLLFVQSRNSHDAIANLLHDCSNKVFQETLFRSFLTWNMFV